MRKHEAHAPSTAIQQQQQRVPADRTPSIVQLVRRLPVNQHSDDAILLVVPILLGHLLTIGANPREILRPAPRRRLAAKEVPPPQHRVSMSDREHFSREREQLAPSIAKLLAVSPVYPGELVVLRIRI